MINPTRLDLISAFPLEFKSIYFFNYREGVPERLIRELKNALGRAPTIPELRQFEKIFHEKIIDLRKQPPSHFFLQNDEEEWIPLISSPNNPANIGNVPIGFLFELGIQSFRGDEIFLFFQFAPNSRPKPPHVLNLSVCDENLEEFPSHGIQAFSFLSDTSKNSNHFYHDDYIFLIPALKNVLPNNFSISQFDDYTLDYFNKKTHRTFGIDFTINLPRHCRLRRDIGESNKGAAIGLHFHFDIECQLYKIFFRFDEDDGDVCEYSPRQCLPKIYQFLHRNTLNDCSLATLAKMADPRDNWRYKTDYNNYETYSPLRFFLEQTFDRLRNDEESPEGKRHPPIVSLPPSYSEEHGSGEVFCTGLFTNDDFSPNFIYAICSRKNRDGLYTHIDWVSASPDNPDRDPRLIFDDPSLPNAGLPYPANWIREPEKMIFDYQKAEADNILFESLHILKNMKNDRILSDYITRRFGHTVMGGNIRYMEPAFREELLKAWTRTRRMLWQNSRMAIPIYYNSQIKLLVPLYLRDRTDPDFDKPSCALVFEDIRDQPSRNALPHSYLYRVPTCLTLEMARADARIISRTESSWLLND